jgi:hypothetical protein
VPLSDFTPHAAKIQLTPGFSPVLHEAAHRNRFNGFNSMIDLENR